MFFPQAGFAVEEDIGELLVPVRRTGDMSQELMVVCHTQQGKINSIYSLVSLDLKGLNGCGKKCFIGIL